MIRCAPWWALLALCTVASPAAAARIDVERNGSSLSLLDPSFQEAVIAAAPVDWLESPGADVWWLSFEGMRVQVQVFPTLRRAGGGQPNCCLSLEVGDAEFWIKVRGVFPAAGQPGGSGNHPVLPIGEEPTVRGPQGPVHTSETSPSSNGQHGASDDATSQGPGGASSDGPGDPGHQASLPSPLQEPALVGGSPIAVVVTQAPEPSLLLLLGVGLVTAARRIRA